MNIELYLPQLNEIFAKRQVILAYLFGSQAEGTAGPLSDIDIAMLIDRTVPRARRSDIHLALIGDLMGLFHTNGIDVVVLNDAPPLLMQQVVKHGSVLYEAEDLAHVNFVVYAMSRYADSAPLRRLREVYLRKWIEGIRKAHQEEPVSVHQR